MLLTGQNDAHREVTSGGHHESHTDCPGIERGPLCWRGLKHLDLHRVLWPCDHGSETPFYIKPWGYLTTWSSYQILKNCSAPWISFIVPVYISLLSLLWGVLAYKMGLSGCILHVKMNMEWRPKPQEFKQFVSNYNYVLSLQTRMNL